MGRGDVRRAPFLTARIRCDGDAAGRLVEFLVEQKFI
jgi:hypothetical protein